MLWSSFSPTRVEFGSGAIDRAGELAAALGDSATLVGSVSSLATGSLARCRASLENAGISVVEYDASITPDPTVHEVNALARSLVASGSEMVVAIGGGSVLDCAKAAAVLAVEGGSAEEHLLDEYGPATASLPVVAIPTTAGTGAELSKGAIVTWPERGLKSGLRGEALLPDVAIVDPTLTMTVPSIQTRYTGFDAFAHAVETYLSRRSTPLTELFSAAAVPRIVANLPLALKDPNDVNARADLSFHAMLMGYNLANSSTCLPHRLQYPIGAHTGTAHGLGLAALFPSWVAVTRTASPDRFAVVAGWISDGLGIPVDDVDEALAIFMDRIDLRPDLADLGVRADDVSVLARETTGSLGNDPWWEDSADLEVILDGAMGRGAR